MDREKMRVMFAAIMPKVLTTLVMVMVMVVMMVIMAMMVMMNVMILAGGSWGAVLGPVVQDL